MKKAIIILSTIALLVTSCVRFTLIPQIETVIYNAETLKPEENVRMTIEIVRQGGGGGVKISRVSDSLGAIRIEPTKRRYFIPVNSMEGLLSIGSPIIFEKEGYLNDTIYLEYDMVKNKDGIRYLDTMYVKFCKVE